MPFLTTLAASFSNSWYFMFSMVTGFVSATILQELGLELSHVIGGVMGGVLAMFYEKKLTFRRAVSLLVAGGIIAGYLTPLVTYLKELPPLVNNGISLVLGLSALSEGQFAINYVNKLKKDDTAT